MDEPPQALIATLILGLELAAAALLLLGFVLATGIWARDALSKRPEARASYRTALARVILIGLEVLLAATVIKTITLGPTLEGMAMLAGMVVIRTALGWTTSLEVNGRWPWQTHR